MLSTMKLNRFVVMLLSTAWCASAVPPSPAAPPANPVEYHLALTEPQTQMVDISIRVDQVAGPTIDFCLPIWRPGRYVVLDPASSVREVRATGDRQQSLEVIKTDKSTWQVSTRGSKSVTLTYRIYANSLNDRTRHVDDTHAFISPSMALMYVPQLRQSPARVTVDAPKDWKIASGLNSVKGRPNVLTAPNYDVLVDSPLEIGHHEVIDAEACGKPFQIVVWGNYPHDFDRAKLKKDFSKIIDAAWAIFGRLPYDRYLFIMHVGAGASGGTEHLNSTVMQTSRAALEDPETYRKLLGLVAHEFFHTWNVKQFRPEGIHPYDYQRENYTKLLWVCEGATTYYTQLLLTRSGLKKPDDYFDNLAENIQTLRTRPAEIVQSLEESSFDSWIHFSRSTPDDVNYNVSFYGKGALVSLLLDMQIREKTRNEHSLDTVMRALFERYPLSGRGYSTDNLIGLINEFTNADFSEFFDNYVSGAEPLPLEDALKVVGLELYFEPAKDESEDVDADEATSKPELEPAPQVAYLGLNLSGNSVSSVLADGPAYTAGLIAGDEIIAIEGRRLGTNELPDRLKQCKPGQAIAVLYSRREEIRTVNITLTGKPEGEWSIRRVKEPTQEQKDAYRSWIGQKWPE